MRRLPACLTCGLLLACSPAPLRRALGAAPVKPARAGERPLATRNAELGALIGAAAVREPAPAGYGLSGAGVQVGVWDEGVALPSHVDLRGRVVPRDLGGPGEHATHTTATLAGSGAGLAAARGMASAARVWAYDWLLDSSEMEDAAAGLSVASNAYGPTLGWSVAPACPEHPMWWGGQDAREDPAFGRYGADAAAVDALIARTDLLMVWPAGNERLDSGVSAGQPHFHAGSCSELFEDAHLQELTLQYRTLGGAAVAKNALTVGAAVDVAPDQLRPERIVALDMSSFGPTDDGRIKPELLAGGEAVRSASAENDHAYSTLSGSSSATAATAGAIALLTELYRSTHAGSDARAAEMRALLVQSAREAGAPGPDYGRGYGLLDAQAAADLIAADGARGGPARALQVAALDDSGPQTFVTERVEPGTPLRVTLAWTDPPARPSSGALDDAMPALVNDLDLVLIGPDGTTARHPWSLDPARPGAPATRDGPNRRDNLEVVDVDAAQNPEGGSFSVRVEAHGALLRGRPQPFALASSVALAPPAQPVLAAPRYVQVVAAAGDPPAPALARLGNRGGGTLRFTARSLSPWLAVSPQSGTAPATLMLEVDPAVLDAGSELLGRVAIDSDDASGTRVLGVIARRQCAPDCSGRSCGPDPRCGQSCGGCSAEQYCSDGQCTPWAASCPQATLGSALGLALASGSGAQAGSLQAGSCGGAGVGVAASWTAPAAGRYAFTTRGSSFDSVLSLRDGGCSDVELACNDDSGALSSALGLQLAQGQQVTALIDGLSAGSDARFELDIERAPCPSVDLGSRLGQGVARGSTYGGLDLLAGSCGGSRSEDARFAWTAPAGGRYRFSLFDPRYQAVLYVRDGDCDGSELGCTAAADVGPLELALAGGQRVAVLVDGRDGRSGAFSLDIVDAQASCGAACNAPAAPGACACDPGCVAAGDCCVDACETCGACRCQRACGGMRCGDDGCGGTCGQCPAGQRCDAGACVADACAGISCDACSQCVDGRCTPLAEGAACEDGDPCTVLDACHGGQCQGEARDCDDGFACTRDRCDPGSGQCRHTRDPSCCEPPCADAGAGTCAPGADACIARLADAGVLGDGGAAHPGDAGRASARPRGGGCACRAAAGPAAHARAPWLLALCALALTWRRRRPRRRPLRTRSR